VSSCVPCLVVLLGVVVVCYDIAEEESFLNKITLDDHIFRLWVHGILHLIGYDDIKDEDAEKMQEVEMLVLKKLNINVKII
jgi:probable rRNA maturation factor